ncbi:lytic transglycosylase domain-containing protein [Marinovum sp.]|uniref:lytic transglycosylase domain-containing protein n=1 Tax=Marinovum sp. TaxID=2024839 RepID=UPI002B26D651|nr:lytic transglycosylase domain-containing protein [Marinovum sp.]
MRRITALLLALLCAAPVARADWSSFYTPTTTAAPAPLQPEARRPAPAGVCIREILKAQLRHNIPGNLLLGIGLQEAGMMHQGELTVWPWVANADGDGRFFDSPGTAASWVRARQAAGVISIDVGCMQINLRWHPEAFASLDQALDPAQNVDYAARLLVRLYEQAGDWTEAAGRYHSTTESYKTAYIGRLRQNLAIANDRLEVFRDLASRGPSRGAAVIPAQTRGTPAAKGLFWSSDLSRNAETADGGRSLFGREPLQAVLPAFEKMF